MRALGGEPLSIEAALARTERVLSGTLGAASARVIVAAFGRRGRLLPRSARALIDEASEAIRYNYEILRNTLDHVGMGIAAFDRDGRLEIFNDRFTDAAVARRRRGGGRRLAACSSAPRPMSWPCCADPRRRRRTRSPPATAASSSCGSIRCPAAASSPPATT